MREKDIRDMAADVLRRKQVREITNGFTRADYEEFITAMMKKYEKITGQKFFE